MRIHEVLRLDLHLKEDMPARTNEHLSNGHIIRSLIYEEYISKTGKGSAGHWSSTIEVQDKFSSEMLPGAWCRSKSGCSCRSSAVESRADALNDAVKQAQREVSQAHMVVGCK